MSFLDNLYQVISVHSDDGVIFAQVLIAEKHEVFDAHFKDNPLVPGFLQIDIAVDILKGIDKNIFLKEIRKAKFKKPIYPCDKIEYRIELNNEQQKIKITIIKEDEEIMIITGVFGIL